MIFWTKIAQKRYSQPKQKSKQHHWILQILISLGTKFHFKQKVLNFGTKFVQKVFTFSVLDRKYSFWGNSVEKIKSVSLSWNLVPKLIYESRYQWWCSLFGFWTWKYISGQKPKKVNITIELYIFKLVYVPNSTLNKQFWLLRPNLPKRGVSGLKRKKWTSSLNSAYLS